MDGLRREEQVRVFLEVHVDVASKKLAPRLGPDMIRYSLRVTVARDDTRVNTLEQTGELPSRRATLRVTAQALLRHDRNSIAVSTSEVGEDVVPDVGLVLLL